MPRRKIISCQPRAHTKKYVGYTADGIVPARKIAKTKPAKKKAETERDELFDFYEKRLSPKQFEIMNLVRKTGIPVERTIRNLNPRKGIERIVVERHGETIDRLSRKKARASLNNLPGMITKIHSLGISHGHPHEYNIYLTPSGRLGLIDFKNAERDPKIFEKTPRQITDFFEMDYFNIASIKIPWFNPIKAIEKIVSGYPVSDKIKAEIMKNIRKMFA